MSGKYLLFMGGMLSLLCSCSSVTLPGDPASPVELVAGNVNTVKPGMRIEIRLEGNPTTGYCWMIDNEQLLKHVKFVSEKQVFDHRQPELVGGPPRPFVFTFDAVSPGRDRIVMAYKRSWEKKAPIETKVFQVEVVR